MKYIGFLKKYDSLNPYSRELNDMLFDTGLDGEQREGIINYLSKGNFLFGWMTFLREDDGSPIGNLNYLTDGIYIWPQYYIYFLKKQTDLIIDIEFAKHVIKNKFVMPKLSDQVLKNLEKAYFDERNLFIKPGRNQNK